MASVWLVAEESFELFVTQSNLCNPHVDVFLICLVKQGVLSLRVGRVRRHQGFTFFAKRIEPFLIPAASFQQFGAIRWAQAFKFGVEATIKIANRRAKSRQTVEE